MTRQVSTQVAAEKLGYTVQHVRRLIHWGQIDAVKTGRDWVVDEGSVGRYITRRQNMKLFSDGQASTQYPFTDSLEHGVAEPSDPNAYSRNGNAPGESVRVTSYSGIVDERLSWSLLQGDCLDALALVPDESVNCVVTSPPYYWQRDYGMDGQIGHEPTIDGYVDALVKCFHEVQRVLRDDGVLFLNLGDTYYSAKGRPHGRDKKHKGRALARKKLRAVDGPGLGLPRKSLIGIPWRVALALQADGWVLRSDIAWKRPGAMPEPTARDRPWRTHEHVFLFSKKPLYWFDRDALDGEEDLWLIPARADNPGAHFAPFPSALAEKCVRCGCPSDGVVLDPFVGSGTTMLVGLELARSVVGIDLSEEYCRFVLDRLEALSSKEQLAHGLDG